TDVETTQKCQGDGKSVRSEEKKDRRGRMRKSEIVVFGFKAVAAFDLITQFSFAVIVTKIDRHEALCTRRLIQQAQAYLAPGRSLVGKVLVDRGFLDGATMFWLDQQGIVFVVPAKLDMRVYTMARSYAKANQGHIQKRSRKVPHGHGKKRWEEELETEVIGIDELPFW